MLSAAQRRVGIIGGVLVSLLLFGTATTFAQSLGDIARQERERRKNQPRRTTRVYTEDDLKKPQILDPQDRARALAGRKSAPVPAEQASEIPVPASLAAIPAPIPLASPAATKPLMPSPAEMRLAEASPRRLRKEPREQTAISHIQRRNLTPPSPRPEALTATTARKQADSSVVVGMRAERGDSVQKRKQVGERVVNTDVARRIPFPRSASGQRPLPSTSEPKQADSPIVAGARVERGDSLWKLAELHLGRGARWRELLALNPQISNPECIRAGDWIRLPSGDSRTAKQVLVRAGDTLWSMARAEFGTGRALTCIARANPQLQTADLIYPGQALVLPPTCPVAP